MGWEEHRKLQKCCSDSSCYYSEIYSIIYLCISHPSTLLTSRPWYVTKLGLGMEPSGGCLSSVCKVLGPILSTVKKIFTKITSYNFRKN